MKTFNIEKLPKEIKEKINDVWFVSGEPEIIGFVDLKDEYEFDFEGHTTGFTSRQDLIDIVSEAKRV